jgi:polyketide cyclase/dehydrase/lipid transport protein
MEYLEYTVITKASPSVAWELFCDCSLWPRFSDIYGDIRWSKGKPWTAGSRLKIEIVRPMKATVDHVITVCSPAKQIAWIDHVLGNTMEQWVTFEALPDGRTRVHTWADITGSAPFLSARNFSDFVRSFIRQWYDSFCAACDQLADGIAVFQ